MREYLCNSPLSAAAAMIGELALIATPPPEGESLILVIEVTGQPAVPYRVWTGTVSAKSGKGGKS